MYFESIEFSKTRTVAVFKDLALNLD